MNRSAPVANGKELAPPQCMIPGEPVIVGSSKVFFSTLDPTVWRVRFRDILHGRGTTLEIPGTGRLREQFCYWFFRLLERQGIRTHLAISYRGRPLDDNGTLRPDGILVLKMDMLALELIARYVTRGHWVDGHKCPLFPPGVELEEPVTELCLKWKGEVQNLSYEQLGPISRSVHKILTLTPLNAILLQQRLAQDDPRVGADVAIALHRHSRLGALRGHLIESREEAERLRDLTLRVNGALREFLASQGWVLEDGKFEVGIPIGCSRREFVVGDEYTQDSSRIRDRQGNSLTKDLHRNKRSASQILEAYARLTEAMRSYAR
jgi:phosphoribosylaminoimidazole-succinocarboxamide synthase